MAIALDGDNLATTGVINSLTAKNSTSGTSIDFTGIPAGVKRITVMFNGVSTNGSSYVQVQLGAGSVTTSGYLGSAANVCGGGSNFSSGFVVLLGIASNVRYGILTICLLGSNTWVCGGVIGNSDNACPAPMGGAVALSGTLDRVRITTVNGTDAFDAGSINVLYE